MSDDAGSYRARPIRRSRRSKSDIEGIKAALWNVAKKNQPVTVRQLFYRLVSLGVIGKTEAEYKGTVCRLLADMRRQRELPFRWVADNTRWMRKPTTYSDLEEAVQETAEFYRRRLWANQDAYLEVWCEKDALTGVLYPITSRYDVPLMVTRGYPSLTFLHTAAEGIAAENKPTFLYYLGDHDPSGVDIPRRIEADLRQMSGGAEIHFQRLAVNIDQIEAWNLPTRPTKRTDTRAKRFRGESVEVDAIPPADLRRLLEAAITRHIDPHALEATRTAEESERALLHTWAERLAEGAA